MSAILEVHDVHKSFHARRGPVHVLRGIDFEVAAGEFVAIMGASGSGKSTLLHLIAGLEPPSSGRITLDGRDLAELSDRQLSHLRRRRVGVVFQSYNLVANLSVWENVELPLVIAGRRTANQADRIREVLVKVHLEDRWDHRPDALSGGEQQRVAIARALLIEPAVLLADEPTGNLDTVARRELYGLLRELAARDGQAVLMVTHDPSGAAAADRVLFLKDGRIVGQMEPEDHTHAQAVATGYQKLVDP